MPEGEFYSLLGPSGSGKTSVLRLIGGFESPDSGTVRLFGQDVTRLPPYKRDVNTVFQDYALFPHLSAPSSTSPPSSTRPRAKHSPGTARNVSRPQTPNHG